MRNVTVLLFLLGISVITIAQTHQDLIQHVNRCKKDFPCKHPQLRSISIRDIIPQSDPGVDYYPPTTVLARCDEHSGCCSENKICKVANSTPVELVFMVNHMIGKSRAKHYEVIDAVNHTSCHCVHNNT